MEIKDYRKSYIRFDERNHNFEQQYDEKYYEKQHKKGKLTAKERIDFLVDEDTFEEIDAFVVPQMTDTKFGKIQKKYGDGVIAGHGKINGRLVMALKMGAPIIGLIDSGGARIQEGIASLAGYANIFQRNVKSSGVIPQISVILGPAAGGAVYSPALTDFIFMARNTSYMFVTGPDVVKEVLSEEVTHEDLGGADVHNQKSGVSQFVYNDEENALLGVKKLLNYLPSNNVETPPLYNVEEIEPHNPEKLRQIIPNDANKPYDVKDIINLIVDRNSLLEISEHFAQNIFIGLARLNRKVIGIVANQPKFLAGV
ncbi:MAG: methylmalonyl-CoA carboxyltransferase, partial [Bacteroidia bacterium]